MILKVWSELPEPYGSGPVDCAYSAGLELAIAGGLEIEDAYTVAGRERFENASGLTEGQQEHGVFSWAPVDHALMTLYGKTFRKAANAVLPTLLNTPGLAIALTGEGAGLPRGTTGRHAITVTTKPLLVYDPMLPMGSPGVPGSASLIAGWSRRVNGDVRYLYRGEYMIEWTPLTGVNGTATLKDDPQIRLIRLSDGQMVKPSSVVYKSDLLIHLGVANVPGPAQNQDAHLVTDAEALCALLIRNSLWQDAPDLADTLADRIARALAVLSET